MFINGNQTDIKFKKTKCMIFGSRQRLENVSHMSNITINGLHQRTVGVTNLDVKLSQHKLLQSQMLIIVHSTSPD